jgi:hypothetical protein
MRILLTLLQIFFGIIFFLIRLNDMGKKTVPKKGGQKNHKYEFK